MKNNNKYRFHKLGGTIHCIAGCCYQGKPEHGNPDNFVECMTIEEAEAQLKARGVVPYKCQKCDWTIDKERAQ